MRVSHAATFALAAAFGLASPAAAQQAEYSDRAEWQDQADADRGTIMDFLARPDVSDAAEGLNVDMQEVGRGVLQMNAQDAAAMADRVRDVEQQMAAANITITTTALIVGLLVLIVLILVL